MDCDDCLEKLYQFLDQELGPTERKEIARHLEGCDDCGDTVVFQEQFLKVIHDCGTSDVAPAELRSASPSDYEARSHPPPPDVARVSRVDICNVSVSI